VIAQTHEELVKKIEDVKQTAVAQIQQPAVSSGPCFAGCWPWHQEPFVNPISGCSSHVVGSDGVHILCAPRHQQHALPVVILAAVPGAP